MLHSFLLAGKFENIQGLILGGFTEMQDNKRPFGKETKEIFTDILRKYSFPIFFDFPGGHQKVNYPFILGEKYQIHTQQ